MGRPDAVLLTGLLVVCGSQEWKRVANIGVPVNMSRTRAGRDRAASIDEVEDEMVVGEEMVTGLDGWASLPDLFEMSPGTGSGLLTPSDILGGRTAPNGALGSGFLTPGGTTQFAISAHVSPVLSRASSPLPYLP